MRLVQRSYVVQFNETQINWNWDCARNLFPCLENGDEIPGIIISLSSVGLHPIIIPVMIVQWGFFGDAPVRAEVVQLLRMLLQNPRRSVPIIIIPATRVHIRICIPTVPMIPLTSLILSLSISSIVARAGLLSVLLVHAVLCLLESEKRIK